MKRGDEAPGIFDVSLPLHSRLVVWPGSSRFKAETLNTIGPCSHSHVSKIEMEVHAGTHVDAPSHFISGGASVENLRLDVLLGSARVVDLEVTRGAIGEGDLERAEVPRDVRRLLLRTRNSALWLSNDSHEFRRDYCALSAGAARWVVRRGIDLIGIDYLSVQSFEDGPETHQILLGAGVIVLEGLDLSRVTPGDYELLCLPLPLAGLEAAPARVVLRQL